MKPNTNGTNVWERTVDACDPYRFEGEWAFLPPHADILRTPDDPAELLGALQESFSVEILTQSGVVVEDEEDSVKLAASLSAPCSPLIALRDAAGKEIVDLLARQGTARGSELPIFATLNEPHVQVLEEGKDDVLVCFSFEDAIVLRALGIPAVPADGLDQLPPCQVERFAEFFGLAVGRSQRVLDQEAAGAEPGRPPVSDDPLLQSASPQDQGADHATSDEGVNEQPGKGANDRASNLVLVNWSPAALDAEEPSGFAAVRSYLGQLNDHMGLDIEEIKIWAVLPEEVERFKFFAAHDDPEHLTEAMLDGLYSNTCSIGEYEVYRRQDQAQPPDYSTALTAVHRRLSGGMDEDLVAESPQQVWQQYNRHLDSEVIQPMIRAAMNASDPLESNAMLALASVSQVFHTKVTSFSASLSKQMATGRSDAGQDEPLRAMLALADQLAKLTREVLRCRDASPITVINMPQQINQESPTLLN